MVSTVHGATRGFLPLLSPSSGVEGSGAPSADGSHAIALPPSPGSSGSTANTASARSSMAAPAEGGGGSSTLRPRFGDGCGGGGSDVSAQRIRPRSEGAPWRTSKLSSFYLRLT